MAYTNKQSVIPSNINYTSKDFSTIKADLIEYTIIELKLRTIENAADRLPPPE